MVSGHCEAGRALYITFRNPTGLQKWWGFSSLFTTALLLASCKIQFLGLYGLLDTFLFLPSKKTYKKETFSSLFLKESSRGEKSLDCREFSAEYIVRLDVCINDTVSTQDHTYTHTWQGRASTYNTYIGAKSLFRIAFRFPTLQMNTSKVSDPRKTVKCTCLNSMSISKIILSATMIQIKMKN